jgi:putative transcriptional regulator
MSAHLIKTFGPFDLEALDPRDRAAAHEHLASCQDCAREYRASAEAFASLAGSLTPIEPRPEVWERVLQTTSTTTRFDAFAQHAAELADLSVAKMRDLLARIDDPGSWLRNALPGMDAISLLHFDGGPTLARAIVGFIKIEAGAEFPDHVHRGDEAALILQGSCRDSGGQLARRGDLLRMRTDTAHSVRALAGPELIYLAVAHEGISLGGELILPGDPRL